MQFNRVKTRSRTNCARGHKFSRVRPARIVHARGSRGIRGVFGHRPVEGVEVARGSRLPRANAAYYAFALLKGGGGGPLVHAHPQKLRLAEMIKTLLSRFPLFASDSDQHAR